MKVRDYSDTADPGARKVDGPGGPQKRIDLTPAPGRSRCGAPTMTLRYAQPSPKAPAPSRETARFQWQFRWQYVGAQEGIRGHAERTKAAQFLEQPASCSRFRTDSQAGRRRFDPGRPLSRSSSPLVAGATAGSQELTTPGWAQRPRRVATLPGPPSGRGSLCLQTATPDPATRCRCSRANMKSAAQGEQTAR